MEASKPVPLLKINDSFASYQELRSAVEKYEKVNRVQFWTRDAKRLHRASPSVYKIVKNHPELEYCSLKLSCIHGGKAFIQKKDFFASSVRKNRGTWKQDCKAEIFVKLNDEKNRLVINRLEEEHNHDIPTAEIFKQLPRLRRLAAEKRRNSKSQTFQNQFDQKSQELDGVCLDNVVKANSLSRSKNFEKITEILKDEYHCTVDLQHDKDGKIFGFFFQDSHMRKCFELFPEILLIDGTYKLQNIRCCIYTFAVENSMGSNTIVGVAVLTVEDKASVDWLLERFKQRNPRCANTTIVITDRQSSEHKVPAHFPNAEALICSSHAAYVLKKDLTQLKVLNITRSEAAQHLNTFLKLTRAETEEEYSSILEDIDDDMPYTLTEYFYKNWHELRHLWVRGLSPIRAHIGGKLEDPNSKFRSTISGCKTFRNFIDRLFSALYLQRVDLKREVNKMMMKVFTREQQTEAEKLYSKTLTPLGFEKIKHHLVVAQQKKKFRFRLKDGDVICQTRGPKTTQFVVSEYSCVCDFFTKLQLPCEHVLTYRHAIKLEMFNECLFSQRWTRKYMQPLLEIEIPPIKLEEKSHEEKFAEAESVCLGLAALCSEVPQSEFRERMELLMQLKRSWENQDKMVLETTEFAHGVKVEIVCTNCEEESDNQDIILEVTS